MNNCIKVSVIIPVYNVENYLKECLDSIICQTIKEIEIICVDDCSSDNSYSILEEYADRDNRIKLIKNKNNSGSGYSRNIGIKASIGEYIGFVDSDDYISEDYFENLYNTAKKYKSDIVNTLNIYDESNNKHNNAIKENRKCFEYEYEYDDLPENLFDNIESYSKYNIRYCPYNKIYLREYIINNNLFFMENKISISEDGDFIMRIFLNSPKVSYNNNSRYFYRYNVSSSINKSKINLNYNLSSIDHMMNTINYCKENFPSFLCKVSSKAWLAPLYMFNIMDNSIKEEYYPYLHKFAKELIIDEKDFINSDNYIFYLLIRKSVNYEDYLYNKFVISNLLEIREKVEYNNNWIKLFGINNSEKYLIIIIFGIKIIIKK